MICIEILSEDRELVKRFMEENSSVQYLYGRKFQGDPETIQMLIDLLKVSIPAVSTIIIAFINSKKHIVIKYNGIEIKGINEKNVLTILEKVCEEEKNKEKSKEENREK